MQVFKSHTQTGSFTRSRRMLACHVRIQFLYELLTIFFYIVIEKNISDVILTRSLPVELPVVRLCKITVWNIQTKLYSNEKIVG